MKMAMESFCSLRMVSEYESRYYIPSARRWDSLVAEPAAEEPKEEVAEPAAEKSASGEQK
ncbi:MAG: hypothetical protein GWP02_05195 [Desulfobulbaceae bacterium]|nr:hypothetical protein [Desulfobulbaceae bacterium]